MKLPLSSGPRIALSLALVCGLGPQFAYAEPQNEEVADQIQIVGTDSGPESFEELDSVSDGTDRILEVDSGLDFEPSELSDLSSDGADVTSDVESAEELAVVSNPSEETMEQALEAMSIAGASSKSLYSLDENAARDAQIVQEYGGADRFEVACEVAKAAFPDGCKQAVIAGSEGWADALSATSLAGVLDCPILLTEQGSLTSSTKETLEELGVESVIIVGGPNTVSSGVESELQNAGLTIEKRLGGADRYEVQMNIYNYAKGNWNGSMIIVASGVKFSDALSASPLAFSKKAPIFLVDANGNLNDSQKSTIGSIAYNGGVQSSVIVGGPASVSTQTEAFLDGVTLVGSEGSEEATRLGGSDRYEASANFAKWAVQQGYLTWDGSAFTTGERPYDALTGSVLQGKDGAAMLLIDGTNSPTVGNFIAGNPTSVKFFGGATSVPSSWRTYIMEQMNLVDGYDAGVSIDSMVDAQTKVSSSSRDDIKAALDPSSYVYGTAEFYQFADISQGYSGKVSADQLDAFVERVCSVNGYSESTLLGQGSAIIEAAKTYNVNEVYLLSHAILESGWGMSALSQGEVAGYEGYYNFYGIGAYDMDPDNMGAALAKSKGWDTPAKALAGAAEWISSNYLSKGQNTLYKMRWNLLSGVASHQYASDLRWASSISLVMAQAYESFGFDLQSTGLTFLYPVYR